MKPGAGETVAGSIPAPTVLGDKMKNIKPYDLRYVEHKWGSYTELVDTRDGRVLGSDGGEPEDNSFCRDWKWVPVELAALESKISALKKELDTVKNQLAMFKGIGRL